MALLPSPQIAVEMALRAPNASAARRGLRNVTTMSFIVASAPVVQSYPAAKANTINHWDVASRLRAWRYKYAKVLPLGNTVPGRSLKKTP